MKIALVVPNFPPEFTGGTEMVALALARALVDTGSDVVVVSGSDRPHAGRDVEHEELAGIQVRRLKRNQHEGYGLDLERPRLLDLLDRLWIDEGVDLVHVHHWSTLSDRLVRRVRAGGRAVIATLHDVWTTCPRFFRSPPAGITCPTGAGRGACAPCCAQGLAQTEEWCRPRIAARDAELRAELAAAQALIVPTRTTAERLAEHLPWDVGAFEAIPHGLLEPIKDSPSEPRAPSAPLCVGTFGNLVEPKGVLFLVYACRGIPGLELHLHGPFLEPAFGELVREKAREFGVALICHGTYSSADPHPARSLDLAVFPSLCEETYGLVVEEALARGVPVIVSDRGALHERVPAGGLVVSVDEVGHLHDALWQMVLAPEELAKLRAAIPSTFPTIRDAARRYLELYRRALAEVSS